MFSLIFTSFWNSLQTYNFLDRNKMKEKKLVCDLKLICIMNLCEITLLFNRAYLLDLK